MSPIFSERISRLTASPVRAILAAAAAILMVAYRVQVEVAKVGFPWLG